jgi:uncharacterized damage-inducible protein DinB
MITPAYCQTMARYNGWMNSNIYHAAATLTDEQRTRNVGAFFGSLNGTLNHLIVADTAWMHRFAPSANLPIPAAQITALNQVLTEDFGQLLESRRALDDAINAMAATLEQQFIDSELFYTRTDGIEMRRPYAIALTHFFNHQTHHRGQATTILMQLGVDPGATDLITMPGVRADAK